MFVCVVVFFWPSLRYEFICLMFIANKHNRLKMWKASVKLDPSDVYQSGGI